MRVPRRLLEHKLSSLLGAEVSVGRFGVALAAGTMDVRDLAVTLPGAADPVFRLPRVKAEVSLTKALRKELSVTSVVLERPSLALVQGPDGSLRLPLLRAMAQSVRNTNAARGDDGSAEGNHRSTSRRWRLDVARLLIVDGEIRFLSTWGRFAGCEVTLAGVLGELVRAGDSAGDGYDFTIIMQPPSISGRPAGGGEVKGVGRVIPASHPAGPPLAADAALVATLTAGRSLEVKVQCASLSRGMVEVEANGDVSLESFLQLLPPAVPLPAGVRNSSGGIRLAANAAYAPEAGWQVSRLEVRAVDVRLPSPHAAPPRAAEPDAVVDAEAEVRDDQPVVG